MAWHDIPMVRCHRCMQHAFTFWWFCIPVVRSCVVVCFRNYSTRFDFQWKLHTLIPFSSIETESIYIYSQCIVVSAQREREAGQEENFVNLVYLFSRWVGFVWLFNIQQLCHPKLFALVCALSQFHKMLINIVCIFCNWNSNYCCLSAEVCLFSC